MAVDVLAMAVAGGGGEEDGDSTLKGDLSALCFPAEVAMVCVITVMCVFVPWQPPASTQCRRHIWRVHAGWSCVVLQRTFPGLEQVNSVARGAFERFCAAEGAVVGWAEGGVKRVGEDGDDEGNCDVPGSEQVGSVVYGVFERFGMAEGAAVGWAEGGAEKAGEDTGEDEGKCEEGGDSVGSTHTKKSQLVI